MAEYIFTNLPQYIPITSRTQFSSAVVKDGYVLLFSEDGESLTAKLSDGTFVTVGGGAGDFYKCASVSDISVDTNTYPDSGTDPADGIYRDNGTTMNGYPVYSKTGYWLWYAGDGWIITDIAPGGDTTEHILFGNNGTTDITDWPEPIAVTYASSGTWTGYKAVLSSGKYSYASTVTSGLSYGEAFTPEIGKIYTNGALAVISGLWDGIPPGAVFYAPLDDDTDTAAETGQSFTITGTPVSALYMGIQSMQFSGSDVIEAASTNIPYSESPLSMSVWVNIASNPSVDSGILSFGAATDGALIALVYNSVGIGVSGHGPGHGMADAVELDFDGTWKHIVVVLGQGESGERSASVYINGVLAHNGTFRYGSYVYTPHIYIGSYFGDAQFIPNFTGRMAGFRIYNRALTSSEITQLFNEFTPETPTP